MQVDETNSKKVVELYPPPDIPAPIQMTPKQSEAHTKIMDAITLLLAACELLEKHWSD